MTDSTKTLICPACGEEMEKIYIEKLQCFIDVCTNGCGGLFFDNREYKKIYEQEDLINQIKQALADKTFKEVDPTYKRVCPACGMKMTKNSTSINGSIIVDDCYGCGGKFLDFGELDKIKAEYKNEDERSKDIMAYLKANMGEEFHEMQAHNLMVQKNNPSGMFDNIIKKFL